MRKLIFDSEHGKTKFIQGEPQEKVIDRQPNISHKNHHDHEKNNINNHNEVIVQVKMNKKDYNKIVAAKAKK